MATTVCRICGALYDGSNDHPFDPCVPCWHKGWRSDAAGNLYRSVSTGIQRFIPTEPELGPRSGGSDGAQG